MDKALVYLVDDYLQGTMEEHLRREVEPHLEPALRDDAFAGTADTAAVSRRSVRSGEMPEETLSDLRAFVLRKRQENPRALEKYLRRAEEERREEVHLLLEAYCAKRLPPTMAFLFETHRNRCPQCGGFLRGLQGGELPPPASTDVVDHIDAFLRPLRRERASVGCRRIAEG